MVSYGDQEFQVWADQIGLDDLDTDLMLKKVNQRKWLYILFYLLVPVFAAAMSSAGEWHNLVSFLAGLDGAVVWITLPFLVESIVFSRILRYGTFQVKPGFFGVIFSLQMYITFLSIFPIIFWIGTTRKQWGIGINKLIKYGFVGDGEDGRKEYAQYLKVRRLPLLIRHGVCVLLTGIAALVLHFSFMADEWYAAGSLAIRLGQLVPMCFTLFLLLEGIGKIVTNIIIKKRMGY